VEQLNATSRVSVNAQIGGTELVRLGSLGLLGSAQGKVDVNGNVGTAAILVNDSADTVARTFTIKTTGGDAVDEDGADIATFEGPITALTLETGTATNTVNLNFGPFSQNGFTATVQSNGTNDSVTASNLAPNQTLDIVGGAGVDNVSLVAGTINGAVNISNSTGLEAVAIDGSNTGAAQVISVSDVKVTGLGDGSYTLSNLKSLSVVGGTAFDNFSVTPSASAAISIDGGPATGTPPDRLDVDTTQATGTQLTVQPGGVGETGTYTFANRQPVSFTRFATITPAFGDLTGTVYNEQTAAVVAGATVLVDENNNGVADAGEPTTTTDASGAFAFEALPVGTFALIAQSSGLENLAAVSVNIAAGMLATPAVIPLVPVAQAGGPDLVATVTATATGKSGSIKPRARIKVSNIGESMASAAQLEIVLLASTDNVLDSIDPQLLTMTTTPVLLKTKKSKTFTLTGTTATSLVKGNYFVLASVDAADAVPESDETNNVAVSSKTVTLAPPAVDLTGKFGKLPKSASKAKVLPVSFVIQNPGTIPAAGTIDFDFVASADKILDDADVSLGTGFPVALHVAAGKSQAAKFKLSISAALPAGSYYLVAKVNSTSSIPESDSTNNVIFSVTPIAIS
jgi:hypothetical protein